jgi:hypothetical protein
MPPAIRHPKSTRSWFSLRIARTVGAMRDRPLVIFAVLDAFPHHRLNADDTPTLAALAAEGGQAAAGGRAVLSASTYPNHASFITGAPPSAHRILTSKALHEGAFRPAHEVGPATPTLFDRCRDAGRRAVLATGDQNLIHVCGGTAADAHWPPNGTLPETAPRGRLGFAADRAVVAGVESLELSRCDFFFLQLDEIDTERHLNGAHTEGSFEQCRATDSALGDILDHFRPRWNDVVVIAVSDHDHEHIERGAIDLAAAAEERGLNVLVDHDGTAAVIVGDVSEATLRELPGVVDSAPLDRHCHLVWGDPGVQFGIDWGLAAHHGSPRTRTQLAVVGGGHMAAKALSRKIQGTRPEGTQWAGWIAELLALGDARF